MIKVCANDVEAGTKVVERSAVEELLCNAVAYIMDWDYPNIITGKRRVIRAYERSKNDSRFITQLEVLACDVLEDAASVINSCISWKECVIRLQEAIDDAVPQALRTYIVVTTAFDFSMNWIFMGEQDWICPWLTWRKILCDPTPLGESEEELVTIIAEASGTDAAILVDEVADPGCSILRSIQRITQSVQARLGTSRDGNGCCVRAAPCITAASASAAAHTSLTLPCDFIAALRHYLHGGFLLTRRTWKGYRYSGPATCRGIPGTPYLIRVERRSEFRQ